MFFQAQEQTGENQPREIDLDPGLLLAQVDSWVDGATRALPSMAVAIVLITVAWLFGSIIKSLIEGRYSKQGRRDLGDRAILEIAPPEHLPLRLVQLRECLVHIATVGVDLGHLQRPRATCLVAQPGKFMQRIEPRRMQEAPPVEL